MRNGVPGRYADLAQSKVGAQEAERRAIAEAMTGKQAVQPEPCKKEVPTIRQYAETFLENYAANHKPSERRSKKQILQAHVLKFFGHLRLDQIRQEDVDAFVAAERKRCAVKTVNNRLAVLSRLLRYAAENGVIAEPNLRCKIAGMSGELSAVPMADVEKLLEAANDNRFRSAVLLAAEAGLRAGEIRGLQWGDVRDGRLTIRRALDRDSFEVIAPKHDKMRVVPLSERLAAALESLPKRGVWVVSRLDGGALSYYGGMWEPIVALYQSAGVTRPPKPIHCLRHTFGTELAARGVPLPVIQELMGHASIETTRRYIHVNEQQKKAAIADVFSWQPRASENDQNKEKPRKS